MPKKKNHGTFYPENIIEVSLVAVFEQTMELITRNTPNKGPGASKMFTDPTYHGLVGSIFHRGRGLNHGQTSASRQAAAGKQQQASRNQRLPP